MQLKSSQLGAVAAITAVVFVFGLVAVNNNAFFYAQPPYPPLLNTSFENYSVVQVGTFNTSMANLTVIDLIFRDPTNSSKIAIRRRMLNLERDEIYVTELQLAVPDNLTASNPVNTSSLKPDYAKAEVGARPLLAPAFITGSLSTDPNATADVLVIGLGGAQMTNYLHYKLPKINMTIAELEPTMVEAARDYFGLLEDDTQRVLVTNGLYYLQDAVKYGWKYDALYIDACPTRYPYDVHIMCPVPVFVNDSSIAMMRKVLTNKGSLVIKMLLLADDVDMLAEEIADKYRKHFPNCAVLEMVTLWNRVLLCSGEDIPKERFQKEEIEKNLIDFYSTMGLVDNECCLEAVNACCITEHPLNSTTTQ